MVCDLFHSNHINFIKSAIEAGYAEIYKPSGVSPSMSIDRHMQLASNEDCGPAGLLPHVKLIVGIHDYEAITEYKEAPVMTLEERVTIVEACRYVDKVIPAAPTTITEEFIKEHDIDLVVHAHHAEEDDKYNHHHAIPKKLGIFKRIDYREGITSTEIKKRIKND